MSARVSLTEHAPWRRIAGEGWTVWLAGTLFGGDRPASLESIAARLATLPDDPTALEPVLRALDGLFAAVIQRPGVTIAIADHIASVPLLLRGTQIAARAADLFENSRLPPGDVDTDAAKIFALSGFTLGTETLSRSTRRLPAGGYAVIREGQVHLGRYTDYAAWRSGIDYSPGVEQRLEEMLHRLIDRAIAQADGREIVAPLSAGLDSRLIVSGLHAHGYKRVKCFAYGQPGNHEAIASRQIAERLGYAWTFMPSTRRSQRAWFASPEHADYVRFGDALVATPFEQDYAAVAALLANGWIDRDALVINGQSGDFITGNHIPTSLGPGTVLADRRPVIDALIAKHHALWGALQTPECIALVRRKLEAELDALDAPHVPGDMGHALYEAVESDNRQSKYVVGGQRVYEALGLEWSMPLWDRPFCEFWKTVPVQHKFRQTLYRETLHRLNWGGVWTDIHDERRIVPGWVRPLRASARLALAPFGRARWHRLERRVFVPLMDPVCNYAGRSCLHVAADRRGFRNAVSWFTADHLARYGLAWDGTPESQA